MARLYADGEGRILRCEYDALTAEAVGEPDPLTGVAETLDIANDTNERLVAVQDWSAFRLVAGVLTYKGQVVPVHPPGPAWRAAQEQADARARILAAIDAALDDYDAALAHWDTLTQAQLKAVVKRLVQVQVQLLRYHRREVL